MQLECLMVHDGTDAAAMHFEVGAGVHFESKKSVTRSKGQEQ